MINDYKNWIVSKKHLLHHLEHHDSIIISKVENVIKTLNFISSLKEEDLNEDYSVIFDCGYSYIYQVVSEIELYLNKYFDNDMHQFLKYELLINYSLYLNDLKEALIENESFSSELNNEMKAINNNIDNILLSKRDFTEKVLDDYDNRLMSILSTDEVILTTPEVYDRIYEELQIMEGHIEE